MTPDKNAATSKGKEILQAIDTINHINVREAESPKEPSTEYKKEL